MDRCKRPRVCVGEWVLTRGYFSCMPEKARQALTLDPVPDFSEASEEVTETRILDGEGTPWRVVVGPGAKAVLLYRCASAGDTLVRAIDCGPFVSFARNRVTDIRLLENSCVWVRCREFQMVLHLLDPYRVCVRLATYPLKLF